MRFKNGRERDPYRLGALWDCMCSLFFPVLSVRLYYYPAESSLLATIFFVLPSLPPALPQGLGFALAFLTIFRFPLLEVLCFLSSSLSKGFAFACTSVLLRGLGLWGWFCLSLSQMFLRANSVSPWCYFAFVQGPAASLQRI